MATYEMKRVPSRQDIRQPLGEMSIDQTKAWDAYGRAGFLSNMNRIYSAFRGMALEGIGHIVEEGNRLADILSPSNAIADNASDAFFVRHPQFNYNGPAAPDNVDVFYTPQGPEIEVADGYIDVNTHPNRPELNVQRGKLDIYMLQYASIEITPPAIDWRI